MDSNWIVFFFQKCYFSRRTFVRTDALMDPFQKICNRPPVKPGCRQAGTNPFIVGRGNTRLLPSQEIFIRNFGEGDDEKRSLYQGAAGDHCRGEKCSIILEIGNRYNRCRSCLQRLMDDFTKSNFSGKDPTSYLDNFRRDKKTGPMSHGKRRGGLRQF